MFDVKYDECGCIKLVPSKGVVSEQLWFCVGGRV